MTKTLEEIYTREWVEHDFAPLREEFAIAARAIARQFGRATRAVVDIGCGPAMLIEELAREPWRSVVGFDGSQHCLDYAAPEIRPHLRHRTIEALLPASVRGAFHPMVHANPPTLVVSTEVAEHLEAALAPHLVELLAAPGCPIVFTAAGPNQDGHHHVNCQPKDYWLDLFARHGIIEDERATAELRARWRGLRRLGHMRSNLLVLT